MFMCVCMCVCVPACVCACGCFVRSCVRVGGWVGACMCVCVLCVFYNTVSLFQPRCLIREANCIWPNATCSLKWLEYVS